jgi:hypothetical protein
MSRPRTLGQHRMSYKLLYRDYTSVFHFLFDRSAPLRRCSEFLKDSITAIILSSYPHRLLNLTETRPRTQRWQSFGRSVGQALISQARKNTLYPRTGKYYFFFRSRHQRKLTKRSYRNCLHFFLNKQPDVPIIQIYSVIKLYMFRASSSNIQDFKHSIISGNTVKTEKIRRRYYQHFCDISDTFHRRWPFKWAAKFSNLATCDFVHVWYGRISNVHEAYSHFPNKWTGRYGIQQNECRQKSLRGVQEMWLMCSGNNLNNLYIHVTVHRNRFLFK